MRRRRAGKRGRVRGGAGMISMCDIGLLVTSPPSRPSPIGEAAGRTVVQKHDASRTAEQLASSGLHYATGVPVQPQPPLEGEGQGGG